MERKLLDTTNARPTMTPASAEPVAYQVSMSDGRWGTIFHHPDKPLGKHRPLYAQPMTTQAAASLAPALEACRIIDEAAKEGHDNVSDLIVHLLSALEPARTALATEADQ